MSKDTCKLNYYSSIGHPSRQFCMSSDTNSSQISARDLADNRSYGQEKRVLSCCVLLWWWFVSNSPPPNLQVWFDPLARAFMLPEAEFMVPLRSLGRPLFVSALNLFTRQYCTSITVCNNDKLVYYLCGEWPRPHLL